MDLLSGVRSPNEASWKRQNQGPVSDSKEGGEGRGRLWTRVEILVHFCAEETANKWQTNHFKGEAVALKNTFEGFRFFFFFLMGLYPKYHSAWSRINYSTDLGLIRVWQPRRE